MRPAAYPLQQPGHDLAERGGDDEVEQHREPVAHSVPGRPATYAVVPSRVQAWSSQAMLSGASSSAPKWSVIDDTGHATAWSRGTISRPPPEAAAETTASTRKPR